MFFFFFSFCFIISFARLLHFVLDLEKQGLRSSTFYFLRKGNYILLKNMLSGDFRSMLQLEEVSFSEEGHAKFKMKYKNKRKEIA